MYEGVTADAALEADTDRSVVVADAAVEVDAVVDSERSGVVVDAAIVLKVTGRRLDVIVGGRGVEPERKHTLG